MGCDLLSLETSLANNIRRHTLNGREYVVADVIMLREGVLNGSKGPLFYPSDEIAKRPGIWNGFPLTANHPIDSAGNPISARSPQAWQKFTIGHVFNDAYSESTKTRNAEAWFDVEIANKVNPLLIPAVLSGKKINVSTGLFTTDEKIQNTLSHSGKDYQHIARNYQPDHLAVLLNDLGACSVKDGCGINLNKGYPEACPYCGAMHEIDSRDGTCNRCGKKVDKVATTNSFTGDNRTEDHMRKELVTWLTTNCGCYKGKEAVLNDEKVFTESELKALKDNAEASTLAINTLKEVGKSLDIPKDTKVSDLPKVVANSIEDMKKSTKVKDEEDGEYENPPKNKKAMPAMNQEQVNNSIKEYLGKLSDKERLDLIASPTINSMVATANAVIEEKKVEMIKVLTANITSTEEKKVKILKLNKKSLEELKELQELIGNVTPINHKTDDDRVLANYFGAAGSSKNGPTATYNRNDVLVPSAVYNSSDEEVTVETE